MTHILLRQAAGIVQTTLFEIVTYSDLLSLLNVQPMGNYFTVQIAFCILPNPLLSAFCLSLLPSCSVQCFITWLLNFWHYGVLQTLAGAQQSLQEKTLGVLANSENLWIPHPSRQSEACRQGNLSLPKFLWRAEASYPSLPFVHTHPCCSVVWSHRSWILSPATCWKKMLALQLCQNAVNLGDPLLQCAWKKPKVLVVV